MKPELQKPAIKISKELKTYLDNNLTSKGQTYEDIIWNLLGIDRVKEN